FPQVGKIMKVAEEFIEAEMLLSAYDLHYNHITPPFDFASLLFLDSGGYEASKDIDLSDIGDTEHHPRHWNRNLYDSVLAAWNTNVPTVLISYDHPRERLSVRDQI